MVLKVAFLSLELEQPWLFTRNGGLPPDNQDWLNKEEIFQARKRKSFKHVVVNVIRSFVFLSFGCVHVYITCFLNFVRRYCLILAVLVIKPGHIYWIYRV